MGGDVSYLHNDKAKYPIPLRLERDVVDKTNLDQILSYKIRSSSGKWVPLSEVTNVVDSSLENAIYHKDLLPIIDALYVLNLVPHDLNLG